MNPNTKKYLTYGAIALVGYIAIVFFARRLGNKPMGIWIYR